MKIRWQKGQSLIELILTIGLAALLLPALLTSVIASREGKAQQAQRAQAVTLLKETEEAIRNARDRDWINIATTGIFHPYIQNGTVWNLASGSATVNGFTQSINITDVERDNNGAIVASGGTVDPSTKRALITISWTQPYSSSLTSTIYFTRSVNLTYQETTQATFNAGTLTGAAVQATTGSGLADDGEIVLGAGGNGNWCSPSLVTNTLDLPGSGYASSVRAIEGKAFAGTGENASGMAYMGVNITDTSPPVASFISQFDGYKTNGVFGDNNYAYISTDTNNKEVVIINISSAPYSESGYFNAPGNVAADSVFVTGNVGYATVVDKLYSFDLSSKTGSRPALDSDGVTLAGTATDLYIIDTYAYITISGVSGTEMQIVDISNTSNLTVVGSLNVDSQSAQAVYVNTSGTRAYLATAASSTQREFFIIDVTTKSSPSLIGSYEANGMDPKGVTAVPGGRVILVGSGGEEYQVLNISNESAPVRCGGVQVDTGVHGVASIVEADGNAFSYIVTGDADAEFKIIEGGPGGSYATSATFESQTFDSGYATAFNRVIANVSQPALTTIRMQVAVTSAVSGSCPASSSSYSYLGPGGDSGQYFTPSNGVITALVPLITSGNYINPGRCFRYKVFLDTTDSGQSPVFYDANVNYSS